MKGWRASKSCAYWFAVNEMLLCRHHHLPYWKGIRRCLPKVTFPHTPILPLLPHHACLTKLEKIKHLLSVIKYPDSWTQLEKNHITRQNKFMLSSWFNFKWALNTAHQTNCFSSFLLSKVTMLFLLKFSTSLPCLIFSLWLCILRWQHRINWADTIADCKATCVYTHLLLLASFYY